MLLELFNFLHFLGLAFGLGGATIATIISMKAEKDKEIGKAVMKIMPSISKLIWLGLVLLIISGIFISYLVSWPLNKQNLIIKHVLVAWIVIIGVFIGTRTSKLKNFDSAQKSKISDMKKMQKLGVNDKSFLKLQKSKISDSYQKQEFLKFKKQIKVLSIINLILWYAVVLLSAFV